MNAKPKLRLVTGSRGKSEFAPRPVQVHYEGGTVGHCKSVRGALLAATKRMLADGSKRANVHYEGVAVADIERNGQSLMLKWKRQTLKIGADWPVKE